MTDDSRLTAQRAGFAAHVAQLGPLDRMLLADDLAIAIAGGCPACDLEADQMCVDCGLCNCDTHETCTRPAAQSWRCTSTNLNTTGNRCSLPTNHHGQDASNNWDLHQDEEGNQW